MFFCEQRLTTGSEFSRTRTKPSPVAAVDNQAAMLTLAEALRTQNLSGTGYWQQHQSNHILPDVLMNGEDQTFVVGDVKGRWSGVGDRSTSNITQSSLSSPSSPGDRPGSGGKGDRYKTELCRTFEENGTCRYGDKCQFAHGVHELRTVSRHPKYKTDLCRTFHTTGFCPYGSRCHFIHSEHEKQMPTNRRDHPTSPAADLGRQTSVEVRHAPSGQLCGGKAPSTDRQLVERLLAVLRTLDQPTGCGGAGLLNHGGVPNQQFANLPYGRKCDGLMQALAMTTATVDNQSPCPSPTSITGIGEDQSLPSSPSYGTFQNHVLPQFHCDRELASYSSCTSTPPGSPSSLSSSGSNSWHSSDFDVDRALNRNRWVGLFPGSENYQSGICHPRELLAQSLVLNSNRSIYA